MPAAGSAVGFFGKLPARGDFVRRDLTQAFVDAWDAWLAAGIAASRARLADEWLAAFLEAPIWHFALAPGIAGPGMAGIFLPSVDRAGRYFPLTLAAEAPAAPLLLGEPAWFAELAAAGVAALAADATLEAFEAAVSALPPPPEAAPPWPFAGGLAGRDPAQLLAASAPPVLLWTLGGARVAAMITALPALPAPEWFDTLLQDRSAAARSAPPGGPSRPSLADTLFGEAPE